MSGWTLEVFPNDCSTRAEAWRRRDRGATRQAARKRRSIRWRTNDPYGVAPTDCWLDAMAPTCRWFSLNYKLNYSPVGSKWLRLCAIKGKTDSRRTTSGVEGGKARAWELERKKIQERKGIPFRPREGLASIRIARGGRHWLEVGLHLPTLIPCICN